MTMGKLFNWLAAALLVYVVASFFSNQDETPSTPTASSPAGLTPAWPPLGDDASTPGEGPVDVFEHNIYLVLDGSGSMADKKCSGNATKMELAKKAVSEFVQSLPESVSLGLTVFDDRGISERMALSTGDRGQFLNTVRTVSPGGGTPLKSAVDMAYEQLLAQATAQLGYGEYHILVVTDGVADSSEDPRRVVNRINQVSPVVIHTIGFCIGTNHALNQPGRTLYTAADDYSSLRQGLDSVLAESPDFKVLSFN